MSTKQDAERRFAQIEGERDYYRKQYEAVKEERDRLKEALSDLVADSGGGEKSCGHNFTCVCAQNKARAALEECDP